MIRCRKDVAQLRTKSTEAIKAANVACTKEDGNELSINALIKRVQKLEQKKWRQDASAEVAIPTINHTCELNFVTLKTGVFQLVATPGLTLVAKVLRPLTMNSEHL